MNTREAVKHRLARVRSGSSGGRPIERSRPASLSYPIGASFTRIVFFRLIATVGPSRTVRVTYLIPVFAMAWGFLFLHEPVTGRMLTACGVIFLGTALASGFASRSDTPTGESREPVL